MRTSLSPEARRLAATACRAWFAAGLLLVALVPAARGSAELLGWLPFWLLLAPLLVLAQVEALAGFSESAAFARRSQRALRRRFHRGQALRVARAPARATLSR
jgi:hypothetical protein